MSYEKRAQRRFDPCSACDVCATQYSCVVAIIDSWMGTKKSWLTAHAKLIAWHCLGWRLKHTSSEQVASLQKSTYVA